MKCFIVGNFFREKVSSGKILVKESDEIKKNCYFLKFSLIRYLILVGKIFPAGFCLVSVIVSASMALWLNIHFWAKCLRFPIPFKLQSFIRSKNCQIDNTGVTLWNKNRNVLKNVHLVIPRGKKFMLFFREPIIQVSAWLEWCLIGA